MLLTQATKCVIKKNEIYNYSWDKQGWINQRNAILIMLLFTDRTC